MSSHPLIQIIEDEPLHAALLERALRQSNFKTCWSSNGHVAWLEVQRLLPALILLDLMLPGLSGQEICRFVRTHPATGHIPIIIVTAAGSEDDCVGGLKLGADDYVVKPFSPREVVSRVEAVLRRTTTGGAEEMAGPDASLIVKEQCFLITLNDRPLTVSKDELALLRFLQSHSNRIIDQRDIPRLPYECGLQDQPRDIDWLVRGLRRKLDNIGVATIDLMPNRRYRFVHPA